MKSQEIFDKVLTHLRKQGHAATGNGICAYRGKNGDMCAIGCLIADDAYDLRIEGKGICDDVVKRVIRESIGRVTERQFALMLELQLAHDRQLRRRGMKRWESRMSGIAYGFHLKYTPPCSAD